MLENLQHDIMANKISPQEVSYLPPQLIYGSEKISSITPYIKEIVYSPNTGLMYQNSDTVRFLLNSTGFLDPYATALSFEFTADNAAYLDNSAHSIIASLVISSNGNIIEEINDYDVITNLVFDCTYNSRLRKTYSQWGFGTDGLDGYDYGFGSTAQFIMNGKADPTLKTPLTTSFCIPLMSNIFGLGLNIQNYKWIPLELFPNLEFSITLNQYALYGFTRNYVIRNVRLVTSQLFFDSSVLRLIKEHSLKNGFLIETQMIQSFQQRRFTGIMPDTYVLHVPRKSVRSLLMIILNLNYESAIDVPKLHRLSRGITRLQVKIGEDYFPFNPIMGNGSTSMGLANCGPFFRELNNIFFRTGLNFADNDITVNNFALDHYDRVKGRSVYGVCLDMIPMSGNMYKSGIDTRFTKPITLETTCTQLNTSPLCCQYVFLEYDYTIKIGLNGFIVKDF